MADRGKGKRVFFGWLIIIYNWPDWVDRAMHSLVREFQTRRPSSARINYNLYIINIRYYKLYIVDLEFFFAKIYLTYVRRDFIIAYK